MDNVVGCSLGGVGTLMFSMSKMLDTRAVCLRPGNRPVHAIGVGSKCTLRLTIGYKLRITVVANKGARTIHGHCRKLNVGSICLTTTIGAQRCTRLGRGCKLRSRRVLCVNSSVPSCRIVHLYKLPYYPTSTTPRVGRATICVSRHGKKCKYNHSIIRRILGTRKG